MKKERWTDKVLHGEVADFGEVEINLEETEIGELEDDLELAGILGESEVGTDDSGNPYKVIGIATAEGAVMVVFSFNCNLAVGDDYQYAAAFVL